jgi:UDP-glucose 4-epimerase
LAPSNYYGETKAEGERLLASEFDNPQPINSVSLRYFNIAGKHSSGLLPGYESTQSHSLFNEIEKVLAGHSKAVQIFGVDWDTHDGTGIRDCLHISDLVKGHLDAFNILNGACATLNLGMGSGQSVYEVVAAYESVVGHPIPKILAKRRNGDVGISYADTSLASKMLSWNPQKTLLDMCRDSYASM